MTTFRLSPFLKSACIACAFLLSACSPKYDWREVRGAGVAFTVLLPAKPASQTRPVNLDGMQVTMTMTATEVDAVTFAVGTAELPDAGHAQKALAAMKTALVRNIGGSVKHEKVSAAAGATVVEIEASGPSANGSGQPRLLLARFIAKDKYVYQLVVAGKEKAISREAVDTFFTSFKPN